MATNKYGFGKLPYGFSTQNKFVGTRAVNLGLPIIKPGLLAADVKDYEWDFGEIVEIARDNETNYEVKPIDENTVEGANIAMILSDIAGGTTRPAVERRNTIGNVPMNLFDFNINNGTVIAAYGGTTNPNLGAQVHLGNGTAGTIAGAVYDAEVVGGTIPTNLVFKSKMYEPTNTTAKTVEIGKGI